jgi:beta-galactosidase
MQPQVVGRDKDDGRVASPEDVRLWSLTSLAGGARGVVNLRWRPLLDGPLFGAFGSYGMNGSRTPRSRMASDLAKWCNHPDQKLVFEARPVQGEIGILVVPEVQEFDHLLNHEGQLATYASAMWGAYRGFFDHGIQADWVHVDDMDAYSALYFPYSIMFTAAQAERIADWVGRGGRLVCEACPGYFGDRGKVGTVQPNMGLDAVFGARERAVEFMPDIGERIAFTFDGRDVAGGGFRQSYRLAGGTARGDFPDGDAAVVEHDHGSGRTLLVGSHPSVAYFRTNGGSNGRYFADVFAWTGLEAHPRSSNPLVQARLHERGTQAVLWLVNPTREAQAGTLALGHRLASLVAGSKRWGADDAVFRDGAFSVPARDALVMELDRHEAP